MISLAEINAASYIEGILRASETKYKQAIFEKFKDKAIEAAGNIFWSSIKSFLPTNGLDSPLTKAIAMLDNPTDAGRAFEKDLKNLLKKGFEEAGINTDQIFLEVGVNNNGDATGNWIQFPQVEGIIRRGEKRPDYVLTPAGSKPRGRSNGIGGPQRSYLIGDVKLQLKTIVNTYIGSGKHAPENPGQWDAIAKYARRNGSNIAGFITLFGDNSKKQREASYEHIMKKAGLEKGFVVFTLSILEGRAWRR